MPTKNNNHIYEQVTADIHAQVTKNKEQLSRAHHKIKQLEERPPQKFFYHKPAEKKGLKQMVLSEGIKVLVATFVALLFAKMVKK